MKVTDFGVAAELQNSIAMCGTFVGTFKYYYYSFIIIIIFSIEFL